MGGPGEDDAARERDDPKGEQRSERDPDREPDQPAAPARAGACIPPDGPGTSLRAQGIRV